MLLNLLRRRNKTGGDNITALTFAETVDEFILEQRLRGNSPKTIEYYGYVFRKFSNFRQCEYITEINLRCCKEYLLWLMDCGLSSVTVQTYCRGFRAYLSWLYQNQYITDNICTAFRLPKAHRAVINVLTDSEIRLLFAQFNTNNFQNVRNRCICLLMLDSGLRLGEVQSLITANVHTKEGYIIVSGKGDKERIAPLSTSTAKAMNQYVRLRPNCSFFFCTSEGQPLTAEAVKDMFRDLKRIPGLERLHPHLLRHTFATRYLENGGNIYSLQNILGHTSLEMVKRYLHMNKTAVLQNFDSLSPYQNLSGTIE